MKEIFPLQGRFLNILGGSDIEKVEEATFKILKEVGVRFDNEKVLEAFKKEGAKVEGKKVFFPRKLIIEALEKAPSSFVLKARDPQYDLKLGNGTIAYTNGFGATQVLDYKAKKYRPATLQDLATFTRLAHQLDQVGYCLLQVSPQDLPKGKIDLYSTWAALKNTTKNIHISIQNAENLSSAMEMVDVVAQDTPKQQYPFYSLGVTPSSPLVYSEDSCEKLLFGAQRGVPFLVVSGGIAGATVPVTLAGALSLQHAEVLAGITLLQILNPGVPCIYGAFTGPMDMKNMKMSLGSPELSLLNGATAQLCRKIRVPFAYGTGGLSDAWVPGIRAGVEKTLTILTPALAGVEVIHHGVSGLLGGANITSYEQMMIDHEICSMVNRFCRGFEVNEKTLAYEVISQVGAGGNFLAQPHTAENFRSEFWLSQFFTSADTQDLEKEDGVLDLAREKIEKFMESEKVPFVSPEISRKMDALLPEILE